MSLSRIQLIPAGVYTAGVKSRVKKRSLFNRRDAIRIKMRKAVSLKANPVGRLSANMPTIRSTPSMSPVVHVADLCGKFGIAHELFEVSSRSQTQKPTEVVVAWDAELAD